MNPHPQTKVKVGPELRARMDTLCDRYGVTLGDLTARALRSFSKHCSGVEIMSSKSPKKESATPRGSVPITVRTERPAGEVRVILDWYMLPYEENPPPIPQVSPEALREEAKLLKMQRNLAARGYA